MNASLLKNLFYQLLIPIFTVILLAAGLISTIYKLDPPNEFALKNISINLSEAEKLPTNHWKKAQLPHDWRELENPQQKVVWYQTKVTPQHDSVLYLPSVNNYITVWLNDRQILKEEYHPSISSNRWNLPRWVALGDIEHPSTLTIRVITDQPGYGLLGQTYIGNSETLRPYYENWYRFHITALEYVSAGMLLTAIFMALIWVQRREESIFGFAAAFMLVWFFHNLQLFIPDLPFPRTFVDWYAKLTLCWMVIFIIIFLHRLLEEKPKRFESFLLGYGVVSSIITFILAFYIPDIYWSLTSRFWDSLTLIMGIYPTYRVVRATLLRNDKTIAFTAMAGTLIVAFGGHDWFMVNLGLPREKGYLIHYSAFVAILVFGALLLKRIINAMDTAEQLNITLEQRIDNAKVKIEKQYQKMEQLKQEQTLAEERERIMRDMHDGIGGHLVSCISIAESQPENTQAIADILRTSLLDLRLMIDSLEPTSKDILSMLAMLRERTEQQLRLVNIQYNWKVRDFSDDFEFPPDITLQILRILQEAITNIIKHADASEITVKTNEIKASDNSPTQIMIEIIDNGKGFDIESPRSGYGITNMHKRAARISASLAIDSSNTGTSFQLLVPVNLHKQ